MKKLVFIAISALFFFGSCNGEEGGENQEPVYDLGSNTTAIYVLNEGTFSGNNAGLTFVANNDEVINDYFTKKNSRGLGDVANDMKLYGNKLYIVMNNSNTIEVVNASTGESLKQIPVPNAMPRQVAFDEGYAYVSCYNGDIVRIDTASLSTSITKVSGDNPEGIAALNGNLYVTNSGGLNYPNYDSTMSVIDVASFTEVDKITIGLNPGRIIPIDNNRILVAVTGNYIDEPSSLKILNTDTKAVEKTIAIQASGFALYNNVLYCYSYDYSTMETSFAKYDIKNDKIDDTPFVNDVSKIKNPYGIAINEVNGDIYIMDAVDMLGTNGTLYCFNSNGTLKFELNTGILPSKMVFLR